MKMTNDEIERARLANECVVREVAVLETLTGERSTAADMRKAANPHGGMVIALLGKLTQPFCTGKEKTDADRRCRTIAVRWCAALAVRDFLTRCGERFPACARAAAQAECTLNGFIEQTQRNGSTLWAWEAADAVREDLRTMYVELAGGEETRARLPNPPRADKGGKHKKRTNVSGAWRTARDVAADFNKAAFMPKGGKRKLGTCDEAKINRWDKGSPDYDRRNQWGYYAELRIDPNLKTEYFEVLARWVEHWEKYKKWDRDHPGKKYRPMRRVDIDPLTQIGTDADGAVQTRPKTTDEIRREKKVAAKLGIKLRKSYA